MILGQDRKKDVFTRARLRMEDGMELLRAFDFEGLGSKKLKKEVFEALYYAEKSGGKNDVFERIAEQLGKKDEKKNRIMLSMVEPVFVAGTGLFLIVLMANFLMPVINGMNLM